MDKLKIKAGNAFLQARKDNVWNGIEHRLELVTSWNGIDFINDSKATDLESVYYSLETIQKPILWLCGNSEDNDKFWGMEKLIKYKVISAYGFGPEVNWDPCIKNWVDVFENHTSLKAAFSRATRNAKAGSVVLLSPGNASYDLYANFKERGEAFRSLVEDWCK